MAPFLGPSPVSTTRVARSPTIMPTLGKPMMAWTCSETRVTEFSGSIMDCCAGALIAAHSRMAEAGIVLRNMTAPQFQLRIMLLRSGYCDGREDYGGRWNRRGRRSSRCRQEIARLEVHDVVLHRD